MVGASFEVEATLQLSAVVGVPSVTFASVVAHVPASTLTLTAAGAIMVGSIISTNKGQSSIESGIPSPSSSVSRLSGIPSLSVSISSSILDKLMSDTSKAPRLL